MSRPAVRVRRVGGPPVVSIRVWIRGGSRVESQPGEALLSGRMLCEGTRRRSWERIHRDAEDLGWSVGSSAGHEAQGLHLDGTADGWRAALEWAAELTLESAFPGDRFDWLRQQARIELEGLADQPDAISEWGFRAQLYDPHPRGRPLQGTLAGLSRLSAGACARFHRRCLERGVIVSVAGAIDTDEVRSEIEDRFAALGEIRSTASADRVPECAGLEPVRSLALPPFADSAHLHLGVVTLRRAEPEIPALQILGVVLGSGSGLTGRLPTRVREAEGLAYACDVSAAAGAGLDPGFFHVHVATAEDRVAKAREVVREELDRLVEAGVAAPEMEAARSFLLGREPFRRETARQWSAILAEAELLALPLDQPDVLRRRLEEVERTEVERVARRFLEQGRLKETIARPRSAGVRAGSGGANRVR